MRALMKKLSTNAGRTRAKVAWKISQAHGRATGPSHADEIAGLYARQ